MTSKRLRRPPTHGPIPDTKTKILIATLWEHFDPNFRSRGRPGLLVDQIVSEADSWNAEVKNPTLHNWILLFDEFCSWYVSLTWVLAKGRGHTDESTVINTFLAISSYIATQHLAIRRLVLQGFDIQAKQLTRSLVEHFDLATLLALRTDLVEIFASSETAEASNHFWHSQLARSKARRYIDQEVYSSIGISSEAVEEIRRWRKEEESVLSMTIHPSILACHMTWFQSGIDETRPWPPFLGAVSDSSQRTLCYAMFAGLEFLIIGYDALFQSSDARRPLLELNEEDEFHRHVRYGLKVLMNLWKFIVEHQDSEELGPTR
jgi:hypothetical protein